MQIRLPMKLHNRFDIEVKDVTTGEIVQRAFAENIVLDNLFSSSYFLTVDNPVGSSIQYGRGTGTLSAGRTTLFNRIGGKVSSAVGIIINQAPIESKGTKKIVILPTEHVGETFTEVGIGRAPTSSDIFTHAFIKDSEGNIISLGPKTNVQEITIYATVFFRPNFDPGIRLAGDLTTYFQQRSNGLVIGACLYGISHIHNADSSNNTYVNGVSKGNKLRFNVRSGSQIKTNIYDFTTNEINGKVKDIWLGSTSSSTSYIHSSSIGVNLETLAENNSAIWSGHEFDKTPLGAGTGSKTIFNLIWDEVWMEKPKAVYVDGVEVLTGITWAANSVTFDTAPADQAVITADYWVKYAPKDTDHILRCELILDFSEGSAS